MREIKFRAWDSSNKEMVTSENCVVGFDGRVRHLAASEASMSHLVLMQFTGLKDANGVEIYEGDILKDAGRIKGHQLIEVFWSETFAQWFIHNLPTRIWSEDLASLVERRRDGVKVVGNIYEHGNLLEGSDATA